MSWLPTSLIWGQLLETASEGTRLALRVVLCRLRPTLIPKGCVGKHHRAIARNGRVLLASALPLDALGDQEVCLRIAPWHRRILPGDAPRPEGVLLCAWPERAARDLSGAGPLYQAILASTAAPDGVLHIDLGGLRVLSLAAVV